jgi:hypothetical protein
MIDRASGLLLAVIGLAVVGVLIVMGVDLVRASRVGPRWKRRLLGAGLGLFSALGLVSILPAAAASAPPAPAVSLDRDMKDFGIRLDELELLLKNETASREAVGQAISRVEKGLDVLAAKQAKEEGDEESISGPLEYLRAKGNRLIAQARERLDAKAAALTDTEEWKHLAVTWKDAEAVATFQRGLYPFDAVGKQRLADALVQASLEAGQLARRKLLTAEEADWLKLDLKAMADATEGVRTKDLAGATCYMIGPLGLYWDERERLETRMPLLEKLEKSDIVRPEVLARVMAMVERDISGLSERSAEGVYPAGDEEDPAVYKAAAGHTRKILERLGQSGGAFERSPDWARALAVWQGVRWTPCKTMEEYVKRLLDGWDDQYMKLAEARVALTRLMLRGIITETERWLLLTNSHRVLDAWRAASAANWEKLRAAEPAPKPAPETDLFGGPGPSLPPRDPGADLASDTLGRMEWALPFLKKLPADTTRQKVVIDEIVRGMESDLEVVARPASRKALEEWPPDYGLAKPPEGEPAPKKQPGLGPQLVRDIKAALEDVRKLLTDKSVEKGS